MNTRAAHLIAGIAIGAITTTIITSNEPETIIEYRTITITETETVYTDLDDLRKDFAETAEQLRRECLYIIERQTGDPLAGIIYHVDRHYQGDACKAADEALAGAW